MNRSRATLLHWHRVFHRVTPRLRLGYTAPDVYITTSLVNVLEQACSRHKPSLQHIWLTPFFVRHKTCSLTTAQGLYLAYSSSVCHIQQSTYNSLNKKTNTMASLFAQRKAAGVAAGARQQQQHSATARRSVVVDVRASAQQQRQQQQQQQQQQPLAIVKQLQRASLAALASALLAAAPPAALADLNRFEADAVRALERCATGWWRGGLVCSGDTCLRHRATRLYLHPARCRYRRSQHLLLLIHNPTPT